jgi:hypothetical protein
MRFALQLFPACVDLAALLRKLRGRPNNSKSSDCRFMALKNRLQQS